MVAAELNPLAKVGGLADVVGALPKALIKIKSLKVSVCLPLYEQLTNFKKPTNFVGEFKLDNFGYIKIYKTFLPGTRVNLYLFYHPSLSRGPIYLHGHGHSSDTNQGRFALFNLAVKEFIKKYQPTTAVLHCHDWHAGLLPLLIKKDPALSHIKTLFTIHNIANQGVWRKSSAQKIGLPIEKINSQHINFMKLAVIYSDHVNTVSETYAKEILTKKFGYNLASLLQIERQKISGILNGIDTDEFNPATDKLIKKNYTIKSINNKNVNKSALQKELGFTTNQDKMLVGVVSRLFEQKGLDWLISVIPKLAKHQIQVVVLGTGDKNIENKLISQAKKYPATLKSIIDFDPALAQKIYAGSDVFLVPSRFEPCGLTQLIAMRYGAIPIVRSTGGLKDTVDQYKKLKNKIYGTGFMFKQENSLALYKTIVKALKVYNNKNDWRELQINCLQKDFSWKQSARKYALLYEQLIKK